MKLLQLNMWMGRLTPQILELVRSEQPDIITGQEVFDIDGPVVFPDNMFDVFSQVTAACNYEHTYFSPAWSVQVSHHTATMGNAVWSKFPIIQSETIFTHGHYNPDLTPENRIENTRNAQFVEIMANGKKLHLVNHHAHWEKDPMGSETSVERMRTLTERIKTYTAEPVICAGDFNVRPGTKTMQLFDGLLEDLTATYKLDSTLSVLGKVHDVACDHIMVNESIAVVGFHKSEALVSDHSALILEFEL